MTDVNENMTGIIITENTERMTRAYRKNHSWNVPLSKQFKSLGWAFTTMGGQSTSEFPFLRVAFIGK